MSDCRLYLITPPIITDLGAFAQSLEAALAAGDVACLQIRLKNLSDAEILAATDVLRPIAQARGVAVLMNDRPDLAQKGQCDGVHIGQEDAPYMEARSLLGPEASIGVTCHDSRHLAMIAAEKGADYVAFGAFFPTTTKDAKSQADLELLEWWSAVMTVASVAIGGITAENCTLPAQAGADFVAISAGVWNHPEGPAKAVAAITRALQDA